MISQRLNAQVQRALRVEARNAVAFRSGHPTELAALASGFTRESLGLREQIFATWSKAAATQGTFWPSNDSSHWVLEKLTARRAGGDFLAIG